MKAEQLIKKYAGENSISDIGICSAEDFEGIRAELEKSADILKGFVEKDIQKRISPRMSMEGAKSIIAAAVSYNRDCCFEIDDEIRGYISMGAAGEDYHLYMMRLLNGLAEILRQKYGAECRCFTDTGPLCDRAVALRAGIGYIGKNGCVIAKNGGAAVFLGYIITDMELEKSSKSKDTCGSCKNCLKSCPTGAISDKGFKTEKCISFLTQIKRPLTDREILSIGLNLYGCDKCQRACMKNMPAENEVEDIAAAMPKIKDIIEMSNREFKETYGKTAIGWRGAAVIKRNALCALLRYRGEKAMEIACGALKSENKLVRQTAAQVIGLMGGGKNGLDALINAEKNEKDTDIILVYRDIIERLKGAGS